MMIIHLQEGNIQILIFCFGIIFRGICRWRTQ